MFPEVTWSSIIKAKRTESKDFGNVG